MPPKVNPTKDNQMENVTEGKTQNVQTKELEFPQPGPSTKSDFTNIRKCIETKRPPLTKEGIERNPVIRQRSNKIVELSLEEEEQVVAEVKKLQLSNATLEKMVIFHLSKKPFSYEQKNSWLCKLNKLRFQRSLSCIPSEIETEASREVEHLKFSEEEISDFCERLTEDDWNPYESTESLTAEAKDDTSSDSEIEMEETEGKSLYLPPRTSPMPNIHRKNSWKKFKKDKNVECAYFKEKIEHDGVKKIIKKIVKTIWRKKKQQYIEKNKCCSIEVGKKEVQHMLFEAVGFMEKRYLGPIKAAARQIYPTETQYDIFERDYESGTYDSQDEFLPNNESINSRINKMSVSVAAATLQEYGLLDLLIATLPLTLSDTDPADTLEFVEILKMARNRVPEHIAFKHVPTMSRSVKEKPISGSTVICIAHVEPPPDLERLERTGAKGYLQQIPNQDDDSETNSISNDDKKSFQLESGSESSAKIDTSGDTTLSSNLESKESGYESSAKIDASGDITLSSEIESKESESESSSKMDLTEASGDIKFIDESSADETEDLLKLSDPSDQLKRDRSPQSPDAQLKKISSG